MSKKAKVSDVRQGVSLYKVHAFPERGPNMAFITRMMVTRAPDARTAIGGMDLGLFAEALHDYMDGSGAYKSEFSLRDAGIEPNKYNSHMTFTSLRKAKSYAARMNAQRLSAAERLRTSGFKRRDLGFTIHAA